MSKTARYARNGAWIGAIGNALWNAFNQWDEMENNPGQKFDFRRLALAGLKGAAGGALVGAGIGAISDFENSKTEPRNTDAILLAAIPEIRLDKNDMTFKRLSKRAREIQVLLDNYYFGRLARPSERFGSTEKDTALHENFDIDIALNFKPKTFQNLEDMYYDVLTFLENNLNDVNLIEIRPQGKSIGIIFELAGKHQRIDVAPIQLTQRRGNRTSGYVYKNNSDGSTHTKTNIAALKGIRLTTTQEKIIILLKNWKFKNDVPLSSHFLERLVLDAYARNYVPRKFTSKVIMVLTHIAENLEYIVIRGVENSNNVISDISSDKKQRIISACRKVIEEYEYQPNSILEFMCD